MTFAMILAIFGPAALVLLDGWRWGWTVTERRQRLAAARSAIAEQNINLLGS